MQKKKNNLIQAAASNVTQCERCGTCLTVCPLYAIHGVERVSPRGKNMIARALSQDGIEPTKEVLNAVNFCLLCRSCVDNCPSKLKVDETMIHAREYLTQLNGGPTLKYHAIGRMLKSRTMVKLAATSLAVMRKIGLNSLIPYGMAPEQYVRKNLTAACAGPAVYGQKIPHSEVKVALKTKVAYFQGCGMQMMFPEAAEDTIRILKTTTSLMIKENVCCGLPHLAHGLRNEFIASAKKNMELYEDVEIIVTDCASCGGTLKHTADYFKDDPQWRQRAEAFSRKIMDLSDFFASIPKGIMVTCIN